MDYQNKTSNSNASSRISSQSKSKNGGKDFKELDIDSKRIANATNVIPDEVPRKDGPGGN